MKTLSKKAKYALRALLALNREAGQGPTLISRLAEQEKIPKKFLELILLELKNAGVVHSKKGKGGGYFLAKPAEDITFGQIVRIFDGPLAPIPCVSESAYVRCDECSDEGTCATRLVMKEVRDAVAKILDGTTLASVERAVKERQPGGMYYI